MTLVAIPILDAMPVRRQAGWGALGSALLHAVVLAAALLVVRVPPLSPPPERIIEVDIVAPPAVTSAPLPAATAQLLARPAPADKPIAADSAVTPAIEAETHETPTGTRHVATRFYTADILREPGSAGLRRTLGTFADSERVTQLCNIEGIEQIKRAESRFAPDTVVGYAFADLVQRGLTLTAAGGAFRSRRRWYGITYSCTVGADLASVSAFSFEVGEPIPEAEWDAHSLTSEDAEE